MRELTVALGVLLAPLVPFVTACADERACHEQMGVAQASVNGVDSHALESLRASRTVVANARAACEKAKLGEEREQLQKAENQLTAQIDLLEKKAAQKSKQPLSPAQLDDLVKNGDPSCPKGQGYQQHETKREVKCSGPQIAEMSLTQLKAYYAERDFKLSTSDAPLTLKAEHHAEVLTFVFDQASDAMPRCLTAVTPPGMSWQEITSRLTGVTPDKLKLGAPVKAARGELALAVDHPEDRPTIRIGACAAAAPAATAASATP